MYSMEQLASPVVCFENIMDQTIKRQQVLQRAAEVIGRDHLAGKLGIPETLLDAWIRGDVAMPDGKWFVLAAILHKAANHKEK
jgi:hypothetical protein